MKGILKVLRTMETQQRLMRENFPTSTSSLEDFLVKLSALLEKDSDLERREVLYFLISHGFSATKNPDILYSKMYEVYFLMTLEGLSRQSLGFSPTLGIWCNGNYLIVRTSESLKIGKESILSDILEEEVEKKYFLSDKSLKKIVKKVD